MSSNFPNHILLGINPVVAVVGLEFDVVAIGFVELGFVFVAVVVVDLVVPHPPLRLLPPVAVVPVVLVLLLPLAPVLGGAAS